MHSHWYRQLLTQSGLYADGIDFIVETWNVNVNNVQSDTRSNRLHAIALGYLVFMSAMSLNLVPVAALLKSGESAVIEHLCQIAANIPYVQQVREALEHAQTSPAEEARKIEFIEASYVVLLSAYAGLIPISLFALLWWEPRQDPVTIQMIKLGRKTLLRSAPVMALPLPINVVFLVGGLYGFGAFYDPAHYHKFPDYILTDDTSLERVVFSMSVSLFISLHWVRFALCYVWAIVIGDVGISREAAYDPKRT